MKEPKPLLREGATDFERQLLSAVMRERPSSQLHARMRRTLGLTGPLAWASSVKAMLGSLAAKGALGAAVVGLVAAGVVYSRTADSTGEPPSVAVAAEAAVPQAAVPQAVLPQAVLPQAVLPATALAPQTPAANEPSLATANDDLREEILLLDRARTALQSGSGASALEQLDQYRQRFPSGVLSREAEQLRQHAGARGVRRQH